MSYEQEDYERGDLSGLVCDIQDDMVTVRFVGAYAPATMSCRLVVRMDGSLAIDPSGLPKRRRQVKTPLLDMPHVRHDSIDVPGNVLGTADYVELEEGSED